MCTKLEFRSDRIFTIRWLLKTSSSLAASSACPRSPLRRRAQRNGAGRPWGRFLTVASSHKAKLSIPENVTSSDAALANLDIPTIAEGFISSATVQQDDEPIDEDPALDEPRFSSLSLIQKCVRASTLKLTHSGASRPRRRRWSGRDGRRLSGWAGSCLGN